MTHIYDSSQTSYKNQNPSYGVKQENEACRDVKTGLGSSSSCPSPRGPRTANLVSSCCLRPRGTVFHNVLVLVLKDRWNSCVRMRTAYEDFIGLCHLWLFFSIEDSPVPLFMTLEYPWCQIHNSYTTKHPCINQHQARWLAVLMRTNCPHEDRLICPHPRPKEQLLYTVLVLVLSLKVLILVLEDQWTVLVPSLVKKGSLSSAHGRK